jgi:hypothetical protein
MRTLALAIVLAVSVPATAFAGPDQKQLSQTRVDAAARAYASALARWKAATTTLDQVVAWSHRWLTALRETPLKGAKLKVALAEHLARMQEVQLAVTDAVGKGMATSADADAIAYFVAEAELWAARGK